MATFSDYMILMFFWLRSTTNNMMWLHCSIILKILQKIWWNSSLSRTPLRFFPAWLHDYVAYIWNPYLDDSSQFTPIKGFVWKIMKSRRKEIEKIFNEKKFEEIPLNKKKMLIDVYEDDIKILSFCQARFRKLFSSYLDL